MNCMRLQMFWYLLRYFGVKRLKCGVWDMMWLNEISCNVYKSFWKPLWSSGQSFWPQNGDVLCFLWGTNWIYICYVEESRPPLWSSGPTSWVLIQRSGFNSRRYQIFWEVVGLSHVSTIEELLERKSSGSGLEIREYGSRDPSRWPRGTFYPPNLALNSPSSGGSSVGIVPSRTQATEFSFSFTNHLIKRACFPSVPQYQDNSADRMYTWTQWYLSATIR
jgi:hypothetical protein